MNEEAGDLAGLTQEEAGERIIAWAKERGLLEKRESYRHSVALCERCESRIEPLISLQWWCSMEELKKPALAALEERKVVYHPESQHRFATDSLENAPDWNISRQLWWGHQLPVWYCPNGHEVVAETEPEACAECGSTELRREEDVLDTWFSSALWPFATLGWPDDTPDLRTYYPGDLNTTAREIIRLWENRMIFSGLELMGDIPFRDVIIHSTVLAPDGRRMSKSLGTGIDPLDVIADHGADATRYGLLKMSSTQDVRFSYGAVEEGRKLANKLWNVSTADSHERRRRTSRVSSRGRSRSAGSSPGSTRRGPSSRTTSPPSTSPHAVQSLYRLTFDDFCDWYAEAIKPRLYDRDEDAAATALAALERLLRLLHPVMPHVTEEIWSNLPGRESRLIVAAWPEPRRELCLRRRRARPRAGGGRDLPAKRRARRARGRRAADLLGRGASRSACRRTGTRRPSANGCARRSRVRRGCWRTSASSPTHRKTSSPASARSSSATGASSMHSAADNVSWIEALSPWPEEFGLGRMRRLLAELGDPQDAFRAVHVVGTNGKTTTTRMCAALLAAEGKTRRRVHVPARDGWGERIQVNGEPVDLEAALARVRPAAEAVGATQFEALTAAALAEFRAAGVDAAVVEAGLGGRLDATNVLDAPVVVLTNVDLEHTDVLGGTREEIAREKLAVIRPGATAVLGEPEWEELAREAGAAAVS